MDPSVISAATYGIAMQLYSVGFASYNSYTGSVCVGQVRQGQCAFMWGSLNGWMLYLSRALDRTQLFQRFGFRPG
jgi:hypothetical protein